MQLETVAKKLTTGGVTGLVVSDTLDRLDVFMRQAGGSLQNHSAAPVRMDEWDR